MTAGAAARRPAALHEAATRSLGWVRVLTVAILASTASVLVGCESQLEKDARERAQLSKRIDEICSLPAGEREAALERLKDESGLVLVCSDGPR